MASLRSIDSGVEFLTQSDRTKIQPAPGLNASFQDGPAAGIEECLPTVAASGEETDGGVVPDHGDFWQLAWTVVSASGTELCVEAEGFSRPLRFRKEFSVSERALSIRYQTTNIGPAECSLLYACHPLFEIETGDRICLANEVSRVLLDYSRKERLGAKGTRLSWPAAAPGVALDEAVPASTGFAEMFYTDRLTKGVCGIYRTSKRQGLAVRFDSAELPYLGLWLCYGGWPESDATPRQNAVALEPTFAPVNSLQEAQAGNLAKSLEAGASLSWSLAFEISEPQSSLDEFRSWMFGSAE